MANPKKRKTKSGRNQRRSHHALTKIKTTTCEKCGKLIKSHHACPSCGYYKNMKVVDVLKKLSKKDRAKIEREEKRAEKETEKSKL